MQDKTLCREMRILLYFWINVNKKLFFKIEIWIFFNWIYITRTLKSYFNRVPVRNVRIASYRNILGTSKQSVFVSFTAPVTSMLCQKYSCRTVVFVGGLFCALGLTTSYFATRLIHLFFTFGVLTGLTKLNNYFQPYFFFKYFQTSFMIFKY